jgi:hypothetical protein
VSAKILVERWGVREWVDSDKVPNERGVKVITQPAKSELIPRVRPAGSGGPWDVFEPDNKGES